MTTETRDIQPTRERVNQVNIQPTPDMNKRASGRYALLRAVFPSLRGMDNESLDELPVPESPYESEMPSYERGMYEAGERKYIEWAEEIAVQMWRNRGARGHMPRISHPFEHDTPIGTYGDLAVHLYHEFKDNRLI